jgi:hypothetical protein
MRNLILHIGMHKTGSSSIQQILFENREVLLKHDCYYPESILMNHSHSLYTLFSSHAEKYHINV